MTPLLVALLVVTAVALIAAVVAIFLATRRRSEPIDVSGLLQQIDSVRGDIRGLSDLFLVPRTRGVVGETILGELLAAWLPPASFELQYIFSNGTRVDAVIRLGRRLVPVDSKFPLESVQRFLESDSDPSVPGNGASGRTDTTRGSEAIPADLRKSFRKHIGDIATRYINPSEGTMGFALMYIPSERVYVELFAGRNEQLMNLALEQNVVPVSPATLFLYLQTVAYGLRGLAIPEDTRRLLDNLSALRVDLASMAKSFELAGGHLRNLSRAFDETGARMQRVELRVDRLDEGHRGE